MLIKCYRFISKIIDVDLLNNSKIPYFSNLSGTIFRGIEWSLTFKYIVIDPKAFQTSIYFIMKLKIRILYDH